MAVFLPLSFSKTSLVRYFFSRDLQSVAAWSLAKPASSLSAVAWSTILLDFGWRVTGALNEKEKEKRMKVFHERGRLVKTSEETVDRSGPLLYSRQTGRSGTSAAAAAVLACLLVPMELPAVLKQRQNLRERGVSAKRIILEHARWESLLFGIACMFWCTLCTNRQRREGRPKESRLLYLAWRARIQTTTAASRLLLVSVSVSVGVPALPPANPVNNVCTTVLAVIYLLTHISLIFSVCAFVLFSDTGLLAAENAFGLLAAAMATDEWMSVCGRRKVLGHDLLITENLVIL